VLALRDRLKTINLGDDMQTKLNPYLGFKNNTRQAMTFYKSVFDGKLDMQTFKDLHASKDPSEDNLIMHSTLVTDGGLTLMASDTPARMEFTPGTNYSISLSGDNESELSGYFNSLADGGTITMPLEKAPWGDTFGMCKDKFGTSWLVNITAATAS
jgi:PhnB protein